jgi:hypothetical protein
MSMLNLPHWELVDAQLFKKLSAFHVIQNFVSFKHTAISLDSGPGDGVHKLVPFKQINFNITLLSAHRSSNYYVFFTFSD